MVYQGGNRGNSGGAPELRAAASLERRVVAARRREQDWSPMRRATLVLASTLAAAAIAGAFLYRRAPPARPLLATPVELAAPQAREPQPTSSAETAPIQPTSPPAATPRTEQTANPAVDDRPIRRRGPARDLATILAEHRTQAIRDIREWYSLLLDDLDLSPERRTDLVTVLAELQVDAAWVGREDGEWLKRGRTIGTARANRGGHR
jgi:hypothetical protein